MSTPEKIRKVERQRERRLTEAPASYRKIGATLKDYRKFFKAQKGLCALCGTKPTRRLHLDHDHTTLRKRGLLCFSCNQKLGWVENIGLAKIIKYLGVTA